MKPGEGTPTSSPSVVGFAGADLSVTTATFFASVPEDEAPVSLEELPAVRFFDVMFDEEGERTP